MMRDPTTDRRWLQVAGLPATPVMSAVRAQIDRVTFFQVLPQSSRILLYDGDKVLGAIDLQPDVKRPIDEAVEQEASGQPEQRIADPSKGDTIIRDLDMSNPDHAILVNGPRVYHDPAREPEFIELPGAKPAPPTIWQRLRHWLTAPSIDDDDRPTQ